MKKISPENFRLVIKNTPLISIDLVIENSEGNILLGKRNNLPAKGYWFVPGGRILKNENFDSAFQRIVKNETGLSKQLEDANFLGIYEHIYPDENFFADPDFGTVVIAYRIKLTDSTLELTLNQHSDYWWATLDEILTDSKIHNNTKNYFNGFLSFSE